MDASPFNRLSAELRNNIYELALTHDEPVDVIHKYLKNYSHVLYVYSYNAKASGLCGLPLACSAMRAECLQLYYASNTFTFSYYREGNALARVREFMDFIGSKNTAALRTINLRCLSPIYTSKSSYKDRVNQTLVERLAQLHDFANQHPNFELSCTLDLDTEFDMVARPGIHNVQRSDYLTVVLEIDMRRLVVSTSNVEGAEGTVGAKLASAAAIDWIMERLDTFRSA